MFLKQRCITFFLIGPDYSICYKPLLIMFKLICINKLALATLSTSEPIKTVSENHPSRHILASMNALCFPGFIDPEPALKWHQKQMTTTILLMLVRETVQGRHHERSQLKSVEIEKQQRLKSFSW